MPALQGYEPAECVAHLRAYGNRLTRGMWVGVDTVCKRNADPEAIVEVLLPVKRERPDLRLHGFGVKQNALDHPPFANCSPQPTTWHGARRPAGTTGPDMRAVLVPEGKTFGDLHRLRKALVITVISYRGKPTERWVRFEPISAFRPSTNPEDNTCNKSVDSRLSKPNSRPSR